MADLFSEAADDGCRRRAAREPREAARASTTSSASSSRLRRAPRSRSRSPRTASPRRSSTARPAAARRRSPASSPRTTGAAFEELSAVSATVADVRGVLQRARDRLGGNGQRTILFLDEIHRFNKAQQDALSRPWRTVSSRSSARRPRTRTSRSTRRCCRAADLRARAAHGRGHLETVVRRGRAGARVELADELVRADRRRAGGDARRR